MDTFDTFYIDALQLCVLLLITTMFIALLRKGTRNHSGRHLLLFIVVGAIHGLYFQDFISDRERLRALLFPVVLPTLFITGPSLFLHTIEFCKKTERKHLYHYLPSLIVLVDVVIYSIFNPEKYSSNVVLVEQNRLSEISFGYIFRSEQLLEFFPIYAGFYVIASIGFAWRFKVKSHTYLTGLLLSMLFTSPVLWLIIQRMISPEVTYLKVISSESLYLMLTLGVPFITIHLVLFTRTTNSYKKLYELQPSLPNPIYLSTQTEIDLFIEGESKNPNSLLLETGVKKDAYLNQTPFTMQQWDVFFKQTNSSYSQMKKHVRISHARRLIKNGYLTNYSVEALSEEVGYQSRTSFYASFEQTAGMKLSEFRKSLGSN